MTRKEEIINAAYNEAEVERQLKMHPQVFEQGFVAGAKWADAHPDIDVRTMAAWQSGYKEAIEKACEWLSAELDKEEERHYIHVHGFDKERREIFLEDFRKAMKGGEE